MDVLADQRDERVLQAAHEREVGVEEVERPEAARGQEDPLSHDVAVSGQPRFSASQVTDQLRYT